MARPGKQGNGRVSTSRRAWQGTRQLRRRSKKAWPFDLPSYDSGDMVALVRVRARDIRCFKPAAVGVLWWRGQDEAVEGVG